GRAGGPLFGLTFAAKDLFDVAGHPTGGGNPDWAQSNPVPERHAWAVQTLLDAGATLVGKTITDEVSLGILGENPFYGTPVNPRAPGHVPGGSSSGSAAAVALGQVPAALGTQTNGSMIRPAAYCGVVGFKPTHDALPFSGVNAFSPTLDTLGVFARDVADCALLASCLADPGRIASEPARVGSAPRVAFLPAFPWVPTGAEQERALQIASNALRSAGARLTAVSLPDAGHEAHLVLRSIMLHEGAQQLGALQLRERPRMSAKLNAALDEGREIDAKTYRAALARRDALIVEAVAWLAPFDAILTPPAPGPAPADLTQTGDPACCTLWSLLGFPAITIPIALSDSGLPLGLQLATIAGDDERLLAVARWCEEHLPFERLA
ncbi:MAG TPA: amidase, partial [Casimicrobiaceae bacterium]|nr:amidase [Casimicrobiaceae bacterium]